MSRRAALTLMAAAVTVLLFVAATVLTRTEPEPRADLVGTEASDAAGARSTLPPMRTVPLPGAEPAAGGGTTSAGGSAPSSTGVEPNRLRIPALGVDAPVVAVGLEPDGSMEIPGATEVGWYEPTQVRPGDPAGSAVLAAHVDYQGQRGVFFDLRSLSEGEEITVVGPDGAERRFRVTSRFQVAKDDLPVEELFRTAGDPALTLITCGGIFDRSDRHYEDNIVVRATPI